MNKWIQWCRETHQRCRKPKRSQLVQGLRLIDCSNRKIAIASREIEYVALSYVWDPSASQTFVSLESGTSLPDALPQTIADSIKITQALGFQYLWIDRYCIPQTAEETYQQIRLMGAIFMNAQVTIVAAAGSDPSVGLPGAGYRGRNVQQQAVAGHVIFCSTFPDAKFTISKSSWMSRAWTYQEAVLSRRLIFFTDDQVYFECLTSHCSESAPLNFKACNSESKQELRKSFARGMFSLDAIEEHNKVELLEHVLIEYTKRTLSRSEDSLRAVLGILILFGQGRFPIHHIFGIPVLTALTADQGFHFTSRRTSACHGFANLLLWRHVRPSYRRSSFPSWSWAGWEGELHSSRDGWMFRVNHDYFSFSKEKCDHTNVLVSFETCSCQYLSWETVSENLHKRSLNDSLTGVL